MSAPHPSEPRIPPLPPDERDAATRELLGAMRVGGDAAGGDALNIFTTLVRHPKLFRRWSAFGGTLLLSGELPARDRELLVLRTARLCDAEYEWGQHVGIGRQAGVTDAEIDAIAATPAGGAWDGPPGWSASDVALLRAADELHTGAVISDATWRDLAAAYDERQLIEVCMVVGQYHLVAFTLNSLGVPPEPGAPGFPS